MRPLVMRPLALLPLGLLAAACAKNQPVPPEPKESILRNSSGADVGRVTFRQVGDRIQVRVRANGLLPGLHGMHLHEVGSCVGPGFQSAGGHLNPGGVMHHGRLNPQGPHLGDLGNLNVGDDGKADRTVVVTGAEARAGLPFFLGDKGMALVVHANRDDEQTDPSGNSGARIACAAIQR